MILYHGTTYSRAKSIVAEGWIYRTNGNRAVYRNTEPGFVSLAARPIEAAEFAARAYLNERLHNGTQKLVVFEVDVNANTVALDKKNGQPVHRMGGASSRADRAVLQVRYGSAALVRYPLAASSVRFPAGPVGFYRRAHRTERRRPGGSAMEAFALRAPIGGNPGANRARTVLLKKQRRNCSGAVLVRIYAFLLSRYFCRPWWLSCAGRGSKYVCGYGCCLV